MDEFFTMDDVHTGGDQSMPTQPRAKSSGIIKKQSSQILREPSPVPVVTPTTLPERQATDMFFEEETVGNGNQSMPPQLPTSMTH